MDDWGLLKRHKPVRSATDGIRFRTNKGRTALGKNIKSVKNGIIDWKGHENGAIRSTLFIIFFSHLTFLFF